MLTLLFIAEHLALQVASSQQPDWLESCLAILSQPSQSSMSICCICIFAAIGHGCGDFACAGNPASAMLNESNNTEMMRVRCITNSLPEYR